MDGAERLLGWFEAGRLVRPSAAELNFVDLVRGLARLAGVDAIESGPGVEEICRLIGPAEHYVFVLADGLGAGLLETLPAGGFLRSHLAGRFQAVFPSTTAVALTTLATGQWPCAHGVAGWWTYLEDFQLTATTLPLTERVTGRPLEEFGVRVEDVFPAESFWGRMPRAPLAVSPARVAHSAFTRYATGGADRVGYDHVGRAMETIAARAAQGSPPTFSYLYLPEADALAHRHGVHHESVHEFLAGLDGQLAALADALAGRARVVVSADHGLVDTPERRRFVWGADDPLLSHLVCPPTGEPTVPLFHVRDGCERAFSEDFAARFGDVFVLITPDDAERLRLFGPEAPSPVLRRRLGSFIGIAAETAAIYFQPAGGQAKVHVGVHASLSAEEMVVPLILA